MRQIGDRVWVWDFSNHAPDYVECPDCGGTGRLRVIFHDDTQASIECRNCSSGYNPPSGKIIIYRGMVSAKQGCITGISIESDGLKYTGEDFYGRSEAEVFDTKEEALAAGNVRQEEYQQEQKDKIAKKEKDTRTWAWNASYHRNQIKKAEKDIEYHTAKLNVASLKAKVERKEKSIQDD